MRAEASRLLGSFEKAQYLTGKSHPFNLVIAVHCSGSLEASAIPRALEQVQRGHPLLRCRIGHRRGRPAFELAEGLPETPFRSLERADDESWRGAVEAELADPFDGDRAPLLRCALLSGGPRQARHELLLSFHHCVVDGTAVVTILRALLDRVCGPPREAAFSSELPPAADDLLPRAHRGLSGTAGATRWLGRNLAREVVERVRGDAQRPPRGDFHCRILPFQLDAEETERLVRATRRRRVGVWAALNAAMLLAVVERHPGSAARSCRYLAFPLLRPYLEPPVPDDVVASYFSILPLSVRIDPGAHLWDLAGSIHHQATAASKRGEKFHSLRWGPMMMKSLLSQRRQRMATVALNYAGAIELPSPDCELRIDGLHAFVSNFPVGPGYTAQARFFQGRLWLDVVYLDSELDAGGAREIAERMRQLLETAAHRTAGGSG